MLNGNNSDIKRKHYAEFNTKQKLASGATVLGRLEPLSFCLLFVAKQILRAEGDQCLV